MKRLIFILLILVFCVNFANAKRLKVFLDKSDHKHWKEHAIRETFITQAVGRYCDSPEAGLLAGCWFAFGYEVMQGLTYDHYGKSDFWDKALDPRGADIGDVAIGWGASLINYVFLQYETDIYLTKNNGINKIVIRKRF